MPLWNNRTYANPEPVKNCSNCEYISVCTDLDGTRMQSTCPQYWDRAVQDIMNKVIDDLDNKPEIETWYKFYHWIKRQNELQRMFDACKPEPDLPIVGIATKDCEKGDIIWLKSTGNFEYVEAPTPRYDWRRYDVDVTVPYNRIQPDKKRPWYKRLWDCLCEWADDGTFYPGDR